MMKFKWGVVAALVLVLTGVGFAEEPAGPPQPTAEHKVLGMFVGDWAGSGEMKPGPHGPGGPMSWTEKCSWFGGAEFNVVCKSEGTSPTGPMKGLGIMGYNTEKKVYTHYGIDSNGWTGHSEGTRTGESWTYQSKDTMGGKTYHSRFTLTMETPTRMAFTWEMSEDGK
ncbi:MAG: DUF1579 family protein, partial [Planctomycetota bacterium]